MLNNNDTNSPDALDPQLPERNSGIVPKPRPNHQRTLEVLRSMTPDQKLAQVFSLNKRTRTLFRAGLRQRFPDLDEAALQKLYLEMMQRCHNRNY